MELYRNIPVVVVAHTPSVGSNLLHFHASAGVGMLHTL